ncbi:hypothetical protein A4A49_65452, partial [Nicotiana attenuata]
VTETRRTVAEFVLLSENMADGYNKLWERPTKLEALVRNIPEGDKFQTLMTRLAYLEAKLATLSQENKKCENNNASEDMGKGKQEVGTSKSKEKGIKFSGRFIYDGPYRARDCPKKAVLNVITAANKRAVLEAMTGDKQTAGVNAIVADERRGQEVLLVNSLGLIN